MIRTTDAGKISMPVPLLNAKAAPEGAVLWLQMIQEQNWADNSPRLSGRLHGRLTGTVEAMEGAFAKHGAPKYLISDQEGVFISDAFRDLLIPWDVKRRFGAVGKHGSIAVTERAIWTLKYEWLKRVPVIRGLDHLAELLGDFVLWYNDYRGHATLGGAVPSVIHRGEQWRKLHSRSNTLSRCGRGRVFRP